MKLFNHPSVGGRPNTDQRIGSGKEGITVPPVKEGAQGRGIIGIDSVEGPDKFVVRLAVVS
jgi:hypothetical protein